MYIYHFNNHGEKNKIEEESRLNDDALYFAMMQLLLYRQRFEINKKNAATLSPPTDFSNRFFSLPIIANVFEN